jgi:Tol biopolymer transport system component
VVTPNSGDSYNTGEFSPDGHRLAYMRWHVQGVKMGIYVSRPDGSKERLITPPRFEAWYPDWSPDGTSILFSDRLFLQRPNVSIYAIHPDGTGLHELTDNPFRIDDWGAAYSPDGTRIVFNSDRRAGCFGCGDLFVMTADGAHTWMVRLPFDAYDVRWGTAPLSSAPSERVSASRVVPGIPFQPWRSSTRRTI